MSLPYIPPTVEQPANKHSYSQGYKCYEALVQLSGYLLGHAYQHRVGRRRKRSHSKYREIEHRGRLGPGHQDQHWQKVSIVKPKKHSNREDYADTIFAKKERY